jgi:hypothetical protein
MVDLFYDMIEDWDLGWAFDPGGLVYWVSTYSSSLKYAIP